MPLSVSRKTHSFLTRWGGNGDYHTQAYYLGFLLFTKLALTSQMPGEPSSQRELELLIAHGIAIDHPILKVWITLVPQTVWVRHVAVSTLFTKLALAIAEE